MLPYQRPTLILQVLWLGIHQPAFLGLLPGAGDPVHAGPPYKKDDNAHIEQKNWTHVRKLLGYVRYDRPAAQAAIHALYRHELRLFQNLVQPSVKLVRKERVGPRLRRRYDAPHTPLERVLAWPGIEARVAAELQRQRDRVDPFALARAIDQQLERIYALANPRHSAPSSSGGPAAVSVPRRMRHRLSIKPAASRRPSPSVASQVARRFLLRSHSQMA